jgi:hypothetical protein
MTYLLASSIATATATVIWSNFVAPTMRVVAGADQAHHIYASVALTLASG